MQNIKYTFNKMTMRSKLQIRVILNLNFQDGRQDIC